MKLMMWTFIVVVMLVVLVRARPEGSNSNGNEDAPTDQVKEENEMRQDGLFSSIFNIGKKLLPKVLGHAGHHHDNNDQDYNDGNEKVAKDFFRAKMPGDVTPCKEAVMKCNQRRRPIKTNPFDILAECCRDYKEICLHDPKLCGAYLPGL